MDLDQIDLLGSDWVTFVLFSVVFTGFFAFMAGNALAKTWRPLWQSIPYALLLGVASRFLVFALFGGDLLSITGYAIDTVILFAIVLTGYHLTLARQMVVQYPWLNERSGPFSWRRKSS